MIKRARPADSCPPSLNSELSDSAGSKERTQVEAWIARQGADPQLKFTAYRSKDVVPALTALFEGKCAYCESKYTASQPVDVEHWRPKALVTLTSPAGARVTRDGYPWLAMAWSNLLPSCIDCNRARGQLLPDPAAPGGWRLMTVGKGSQFPLADETATLRSLEPPPGGEQPLLLDPCAEDPGEYFDFGADGVLLPKAGLDVAHCRRATESIRVYALNRKGLVDERCRHLLWLELEFRLIRFLYEASGNLSLPEAHRSAASVLVTDALEALQHRTRTEVPYSQFIAQRLRTFLQHELGVGRE